jgi:hypothetical protein
VYIFTNLHEINVCGVMILTGNLSSFYLPPLIMCHLLHCTANSVTGFKAVLDAVLLYSRHLLALPEYSNLTIFCGESKLFFFWFCVLCRKENKASSLQVRWLFGSIHFAAILNCWSCQLKTTNWCTICILLTCTDSLPSSYMKILFLGTYYPFVF